MKQRGKSSGTKAMRVPVRERNRGGNFPKKAVCSWISSFIKLFITISLFVLLVYVYDKRIVYGFAREIGWLDNGISLSRDRQDTDNIKQIHTEEKENLHLRKANSVDGKIAVPEAEELEQEILLKQGGVGAVERRESEQTNKKHVLQVLTNSDKHPHLKTRFDVCMRSILEKSSADLHFFFVVDTASEKFILECLQQVTDEGVSKSKFQFTFLHIDVLGKKLLPYVGDLQAQLRGSHPYYTDAIFFLSMGIHQHILPPHVQRLVIMDTDLKFMSDIRFLFDHFDRFSDDNVMGIAHEQQPVYRHLFSLYRTQNKGTKVGDPPPNGRTGFNSGVMLLDFEKMRASQSYREILNVGFIQQYSEKYHFKGHLGDQDFFTLASMEHPELFYVLPCTWNKQLCIWWKDKGYESVFDLYFNCPEPIHVYHGNCNTPIP